MIVPVRARTARGAGLRIRRPGRTRCRHPGWQRRHSAVARAHGDVPGSQRRERGLHRFWWDVPALRGAMHMQVDGRALRHAAAAVDVGPVACLCGGAGRGEGGSGVEIYRGRC